MGRKDWSPRIPDPILTAVIFRVWPEGDVIAQMQGGFSPEDPDLLRGDTLFPAIEISSQVLGFDSAS